jgi:catecholate siderophore receptor
MRIVLVTNQLMNPYSIQTVTPPEFRSPLRSALPGKTLRCKRTPLARAWAVLALSTAPVACALAAETQTVTIQGERPSEPDPAFNTRRSALSKLPANLLDVPQSVTVLNQALLQSQGATSLVDALRNVPGITLGGAEGGQIGNNINLNGFTARTDIYLDGFRDRGQYYRDSFALDSVEVLMGPSSMLFGRGSTGGVINQVTRKPTLSPRSELSASVTSNGLARSTLDLDRRLSDTSALRVAAMAQDGRPTTREVMKNRDAGLAPSLKLGIGTPTEITLSALLQHNHDMPDYGVSPLNGQPVSVDRKTYFGYTSDRTVQDVLALGANIQHRLPGDSQLRNQTQYNQVRVDAVETASQGLGTVGTNGFAALVPAATSTLPLDQLSVRLQSHDRVIRDRSLFNQTEFSARAGTGSWQHDLLAGLEIGRDTYRNQAYYRNGSCNGVAMNPATGTSGYVGCEPLVDPVYTASPANAPSRAGNLATAWGNTTAAYLSDTASVSPNFKLVGGLRQDRFQAHIANSINSATTPASTAFPQLDQTVNFTSVRAGSLWQPGPWQSYYLSYSTSFNPSLEQLTSTTGLSQPLPPEKNRAYEAGGKWDLAAGLLSVDAALFQITQSNSRSQNTDNTYTATGTIRVNGLRTGASGQLAHGWKLFAGWSLLDAEIVNGIAVGTQGKVPANTARQSATLWTTFDLAPHWQLGGGSVAQSSRYLNNTDLVRVGGYARWDGMLAYVQPSYDIRLNVFNLANKAYYDALIQSDGGRAVPGSGRSAMLGLSVRF